MFIGLLGNEVKMVGGYAMIDCSGLVLTNNESQTINGMFKQMQNAYNSGKAIWAHNCGYNEGVLSPVPVMVLNEGGRYCATSSILQIWVDNSDACTVVSLLS